MDDLQGELGRVTTKITLAWPDEVWTENAQWADEILADRGIENITEDEVRLLARAGLMPNMRAITTKWGSIIVYRKETGIEKKAFYFDVFEWDREKHLLQGKKYAEYLGREIGFPIMPTEESLIDGSKLEITGTPQQTKNVFGTFDQYQEGLGFVTSEITRRWSDKQWHDNYWWLRAVWEENGREVVSLRDFLSLASTLHIGPSPDAAAKRWGTLTEYGLFVGHESDQYKRILPKEGLLRAAINHVQETGQPLSKDSLSRSKILSADMATRWFGGLHALNFRLGIISGALGWDKNKLLWWAVALYLPETGELPSRSGMDKWSTTDRGPSPFKTCRVFGNLTTYKTEADKARQWMEGQVWKFDQNGHTEGTRLGADIVRLAIMRNPELFHPGRELQLEELLPLARLKEAGVHMRTIAALMNTGISFSHPKSQLNLLAGALAKEGMLTSSVLRSLEPYIIGLAPPEVSMSWNDFVLDYLIQHKPNPVKR